MADKIKNKVLIIDDDKWMHRILSLHLRRMGFEVESCLNPIEGVSLAINNEPKVIILDVMMPELNGKTLLKILKTIDGVKEIPTLILSSILNKELIKEGIKNGAVGFISKPFTAEVLFSKIYEVSQEDIKEQLDEFAEDYLKNPPKESIQEKNDNEKINMKKVPFEDNKRPNESKSEKSNPGIKKDFIIK